MMKNPWFTILLSRMKFPPACWLLAVLLFSFPPSQGLGAQSGRTVPSQPGARQSATATAAISAADFSRMVREFSEEEGNFPSDNYVSNETSYLHVVDKLKEMGVSGGAYVGVGPEQNFTYIAKVRPRIAFLVDIRREAIVQHLMYKAIFQKAANRAQFLSWLFSRPLAGKDAPAGNSSIEKLVEYFEEAPTSDKIFADNLASIRKTIEKDFEVPLSPHDLQLLQHVYTAFRQGNLHIFTRWFPRDSGATWYGGSPTLKDLLLETDLHGKMGNFLATEDDYNFVRDLHRANRIIPVVGDFAGSKALATVGGYLRDNGYSVSAFYTSNVEQYLFGDGVFGAFAENVRKLPINDKSVFIRAGRTGHPANVSGHRMTTLLQKIAVFLEDYDEGIYTDYGRLITSHYIAGEQP